MSHVYTIIRKDLSLADQLVQACHSSLQAGAEFLSPDHVPSLVLLESRDSAHLEEIASLLDRKTIRYHKFYEPDGEGEYTSITTEPLSPEHRKALGNLRLWRA